MTDDKIPRLSRRRVLGTLGALGAGAALGGAGTTAFFSDEETFENNTLTAGALDLVVDWEEHYHLTNEQVPVPVDDGTIDGVLLVDRSVQDPQPPEGYFGFPDPQDPMVWVHELAIDEYMDLTSLEAYPDGDDDGIQDPLVEFDACDDFAQLDEQMDPTNGRGAGKRTLNGDTVTNYQEVVEEGAPADWKPLISLDDVKPGDFGEVTLSAHLCDNPGYLWLQGELVNASENGLTEPEWKDEDEDQMYDEDGNLVLKDPDNDPDGPTVELLDSVETLLWYDEDGDNVFEPGGVEGDAEVAIVLDRSGSMGDDDVPGSKLDRAIDGAVTLVNSLGDSASVGVVSFDDQVTQEIGLTELGTGRANVISAIEGIEGPGGTTNIESAIDSAQSMLAGGPSDTDIIVLLTDGAPNVNGDNTDENDPNFQNADPADNAQAAKDAGTEIYTIGYDLANAATIALMEEMASEPKDSHAYTDVDIDEIEQVFAQIGQIIAGEQSFFRGTLRELLTAASAGNGVGLDGNRATAERDPFVDCTTNAVGMAWWLPIDHANEIQTDSVSFNLGFYTEQARHNDGSGMASTPTTNGQ